MIELTGKQIQEYHELLDKYFEYHPPHSDQHLRYRKIRKLGRELAKTILLCTPKCADQSAAIRKVREAVMTANAAIACEEVAETPPETITTE